MEMSVLRYVSQEGLKGLAARLAARARLLVPTREGTSVIFREYAGGELCLARAAVSPKAAVLPACETLFTFACTKENAEKDAYKVAGKPAVELSAKQDAAPTVIFACRPCDAKGIAVLDRPYLNGTYRDPYYAARRKALLVVSLTCDAPCATCFCDWVGKGPTDSEGSDVLMTRIEGGFALESVSREGEALLRDGNLADVTTEGEVHGAAVSAARKAGLDMRPPAPDLGKAREALGKRFADVGFWQDMTAHCLACGACTYMCPTCYCFNISDEGNGVEGRRLRSQDSCMSSLFTREASGHNPRAAKALRMRNRVLHKFSYYPTVWNGAFSCSGCGRCIISCPVQLDIRRIVLAGMAE
jgi:formate hydrogenlyase subunit 6/NADH:ubiquinone oxidoreductase subunit I